MRTMRLGITAAVRIGMVLGLLVLALVVGNGASALEEPGHWENGSGTVGIYDDDWGDADWYYDEYGPGLFDAGDWDVSQEYYWGSYDDTWDEDDWFFDSYDDAGDEGLFDV